TTRSDRESPCPVCRSRACLLRRRFRGCGAGRLCGSRGTPPRSAVAHRGWWCQVLRPAVRASDGSAIGRPRRAHRRRTPTALRRATRPEHGRACPVAAFDHRPYTATCCPPYHVERSLTSWSLWVV